MSVVLNLFALAASIGATGDRSAHSSPRFDPAEVAWAALPGQAIVQGTPNHSLGGNPQQCTVVTLVPFSRHEERVAKFFHGEELNEIFYFGHGVKEIYHGADYPMIKDKRNRREWIDQKHFKQDCDPSGFVQFRNIPAGNYLLGIRYVTGTTHLSSGIMGGMHTQSIPGGFSIRRRIEVPETGTVEFDSSGQTKR